MNIKVLGGGCKSCEALLRSAKQAVVNRGIDAEIEYCHRRAKIDHKGTEIKAISEKEIKELEAFINAYPRKILGGVSAKTFSQAAA